MLMAICVGQENPDSNLSKIDFDAISTIKVSYLNFNDTILLSSSFLNTFPCENIESYSTKLFGNGTEYIRLKVQKPECVDIRLAEFSIDSIKIASKETFSRKDLEITCFLIPFDTLKLEVDFAKGKLVEHSIRLNGKYAAISEYYRDKNVYFNGNDFMMKKGILASQETNMNVFKNSIDSITNVELKFLEENQKENVLPEWFVKYESSNLKYIALSFKLSEPLLINFNTINGLSETPIPKDYFAFVDEFPFDNQSDFFSIYYILSLRDYYSNYYLPKQDSNKSDSTTKLTWIEGLTSFSVSHLSPYHSDLLLTREFDIISSFNMLTKNDFEILVNAIRDPDLNSYVIESNNKKKLKKGDNAPSFYIKDEFSKYHYLKDYKGNVVYLSFWFAGCKPCIVEFPFENKLVDVFTNDKVKIISICLNTKEEIWKQQIIKYGLKSINLFANENWEQIIKKAYEISGFPHYVLIDKNGKIADNNCVHPSQGVEQDIRKLLNE